MQDRDNEIELLKRQLEEFQVAATAAPARSQELSMAGASISGGGSAVLEQPGSGSWPSGPIFTSTASGPESRGR